MIARPVRPAAAMIRYRQAGARRQSICREGTAASGCRSGDDATAILEVMAASGCRFGDDAIAILSENNTFCVALLGIDKRISDRLLDRPYEIA